MNNDLNKWYEFKILYSSSKQEYTCFRALIIDDTTYKIICDDNNLFKKQFIDIIKGNAILYVKNKEKLDKLINSNLNSYKSLNQIYDIIPINEGNAIENLKKYISIKNDSAKHSRLVLTEAENFDIPFISSVFEGPDFNFQKGMSLEHSIVASQTVMKIWRLTSKIFPIGQEITKQKAASLHYDLFTSDINNGAIDFLYKIISHSNNAILNLNDHDKEYHDTIFGIVKALLHAVTIKDLEKLTFTIHNKQPIVINAKNINKVYSDIFNKNIEINSIVPDKFSNKNLSFSMGKYSCYIKDNLEKKDSFIELVKKAIDTGSKITVLGILKDNHPNTVIVNNIYVV